MTQTKLAATSFLLAAVCSAEDFDIISRSTPRPGVDQIRIDRPDPTKRSVYYPQITFQPGDGVTISAGGCVQSGGSGPTWHRYVDPSGGDADKLYHGLITIPFATGSLERIQKYQNQQVHVAANAPPGRLQLQLGFEDDDYSDNGYSRHDDGPDNQCKGADGGPAWVILTVVHKVGGGASGGAREWDLNITTFDDNGIPLNPDWQANVANHRFPNPDTCRWPWNDPSNLPDCVSTGQITNKDEHYTCEGWYHATDHGLGGHANWTPATFTGMVTWGGHSNSVVDDDDYYVDIDTAGAAGATAGTPRGVHVEFDSSETVDVITKDFKLPLWRDFQRAVDSGEDSHQAHGFLDGKDSIVTGLLGLDFIHNPISAESHPAWAFAWHAHSVWFDDTWAFFVRGGGNQGYCGGNQHYISYLGNRYTFRFPWPPNATGGAAIAGTTFLANTTVGAATVSFPPNEAVLLTFHDLPDSTSPWLIAGELHVKWTGSPALTSVVGTRATTITARVSDRQKRTPSETAESFIVDAVAGLTSAQRAVYMANAPKKVRAASRPVIAVRWHTGPPPTKLVTKQHPMVRSVPDEVSTAHKNAQIEALKKAGGKVPTPVR